jgi:hypothetical protein
MVTIKMKTSFNNISAILNVILLTVIVILLVKNMLVEKQIKDVIRGRIFAEIAMYNVFCQKIGSGETKFVEQMMRSSITNDVFIIESEAYGMPDARQRQILSNAPAMLKN